MAEIFKEKNENNLQVNFSYTQSLVEILNHINSTIVISTYQAGIIMSIGVLNNKLNLDYKNFERPMGMYYANNHMWGGIGHGIWEFVNFKEAAKKIDSKIIYDGAYIPLNIHNTGNIDIHEMEFVKDRLYFVNTKFSCICVKDDKYSFKPVWKPPFISDLLPVDKCHLNGLCSKNGAIKYVTALGMSDEPLGWRENKTNGGILMDIQTNEILLENLSMPHSPRWYKNKLWFLESGKGSLSYYDVKNKKTYQVAEVPGFTRGLAFFENLAFVGVSKVRESATFSGLPVTKLSKRISGVWIINLLNNKILGFIEFKNGIDEIFAVNIIPNKNIKIFDYNDSFVKAHYLIAQEDYKYIKLPEKPMELAATHFEKGNELFNENKKEEALKEYEKTLEIDANFLPAVLQMSKIYFSFNNLEKAENLAKKVIENDASIVEAYILLTKIYLKIENKTAAKEILLKAKNIEPENLEIKELLNTINLD